MENISITVIVLVLSFLFLLLCIYVYNRYIFEFEDYFYDDILKLSYTFVALGIVRALFHTLVLEFLNIDVTRGYTDSLWHIMYLIFYLVFPCSIIYIVYQAFSFKHLFKKNKFILAVLFSVFQCWSIFFLAQTSTYGFANPKLSTFFLSIKSFCIDKVLPILIVIKDFLWKYIKFIGNVIGEFFIMLWGLIQEYSFNIDKYFEYFLDKNGLTPNTTTKVIFSFIALIMMLFLWRAYRQIKFGLSSNSNKIRHYSQKKRLMEHNVNIWRKKRMEVFDSMTINDDNYANCNIRRIIIEKEAECEKMEVYFEKKAESYRKKIKRIEEKIRGNEMRC